MKYYKCPNCGAVSSGWMSNCPHCHTAHVEITEEQYEAEINPSFYDVQDVLDAGFNLEPLKCRHCGDVGHVVFHQYIGDAYCENCGEWQLESVAENA